MSFWDTHKSALSVAGLGLLVLAVCYFALIRPAGAQADACRGTIADNEKKLAKYYLELENENARFRLPTIQKVQRDCEKRYNEYAGQLKALKERLRFPFEDFEYIQKLKSQERPGIYLSQTYVDVKWQLHMTATNRNVAELLERDWMGFSVPTDTNLVFKTAAAAANRPPNSPPAVIAEEELRKLCLAEQVTQLAINAGISRILKVSPLGKAEEAATQLKPNSKFRPGNGEPERIPVEYPNRFIVNYPVSATMIGSPDAVMKFFHSVRQDKRFLVIRSFRIVSREDKDLPSDVAGRMRLGDVCVEISAACMDFREGETKSAAPPPVYVPPVGPIGA